MFPGVDTLGKKAGGFHDNIRAHAGPVDFRGVFHLEDFESPAFDGNGFFGVSYVMRQIAEDGIVLKQVRKSLRVRDVVDGDELDVFVVESRANDVAADAAEAVDTNLDGHAASDG